MTIRRVWAMGAVLALTATIAAQPGPGGGGLGGPPTGAGGGAGGSGTGSPPKKGGSGGGGGSSGIGGGRGGGGNPTGGAGGSGGMPGGLGGSGFGSGGMGAGTGGPPAKKSALEEALDEAFKNNPDIKVAQAKVFEAEAQLHRTKMDLARKVTKLTETIKSDEVTVNDYSRRLAAYGKMAGAVSKDDIYTTEAALLKAKSALAESKAELNYLLGKGLPPEAASRVRLWLGERTSAFVPWDIAGSGAGAGGGMGGLVGGESPKPEIRPAPAVKAPEGLREKLTKVVEFGIPDKATLGDIFAQMSKRFDLPAFHFRTSSGPKDLKTLEVPATYQDGENIPKVTLAAFLQCIDDLTDNKFVVLVREYGFLVVEKEKVPPGAVTLEAFLKAKG